MEWGGLQICPGSPANGALSPVIAANFQPFNRICVPAHGEDLDDFIAFTRGS